MILSVLICSLPESGNYLLQMLGYLGTLPEGVEVVVDNRGREIPTGTKRNDLIQRAKGEYFVFVDCDDKVEPDYVSSIVAALETRPDCVPIDGTYIDVVNNNYTLYWTMRIGEKYEARGNHIFRWPNHLAVMKKSLVQHVKFPPKWRGEDYEWSKQINDMGILKTQVIIPKRIYTYLFISNK
jgi:glycosyltransferase involved in cell wall biosynthesis